MTLYRPDPKFYQKQIKAQEKLRKKFEQASYDSDRRGYVIDGEVYNESSRNARVKAINDEIARIKAEEKKFGKYGPNFGENVQPDEAGRQFTELLDKARAIEVTDFDSALANLEAWKAVTDFASANPDMVVVERVDTPDGPMNARIDPFANPGIKNLLERGLPSARETALQEAERGTVEAKTEFRGSGSAAREVTVKTVTNQAELDRRLKAVDTAVKAPSQATRVQPTTGATAATTTTAAPTGTTRGATGPTGPARTATTGTRRPSFTTADAAERAAMARGATGPSPAPTGPTTPATPGGGATTVRGGRGTRPPKVVNWEPKFREMFPTQAWLLDLDRAKYADVFKLFQTAVETRMYETQEGLQRFAAQLDNTSFYKELASTGKAREIRGLVGDLGFDTVPFNKFLTTSMNMGWEGDTLRQEVYKEAFRKDPATGQYVNQTAVKRIKASTPYLAVKDIGKQFFSTVDDATTEQVLTGAMIQDDVIRQQREIAKGKYAHLAGLIDQGLTLEGISSSYRARAAALLEKNENDIDMGSADFAQAFNFGEEGKKRMMGDGEWEILLRSDPRFGWRKTQNAKQEATQLAASISQAFQRVL